MATVFNKSHYDSDQGMLTNVWGPALWHVLHTISFNYPKKPTEKQKRDYKRFLISLENVLPCRYCRENFKKNCKTAKLCDKVFKSRNSFSRFIYRLHCSVNKALDKEKCDSYKKVRDKYEHFRARCSRKQPKKSSRKRRKEKGCVDPLKGRKLKCVIDVVPKNSRRRSFRFYRPMA